jgi:hypothetical protein
VITLSRLDFLLKASKIESKTGIDASNSESAKILMSMTRINNYFFAMTISSDIVDNNRFSSL